MALLKDLTVFGASRFISDAFGNNIYANKHITNGGTASQFVKGDGTLDSNIYALNSALSNYVKLDAGTAEQTIKTTSSSVTNGVLELWRAIGSGYSMLGFSNGATKTKLGMIGFTGTANELIFRNTSNTDYKIAHAGNVTNYDASIGTSNTKIATIAGKDIYAKIGNFAPASHTHTFAQITNKITAGNEFNFVDVEEGTIWINYRRASGSSATTNTTQFNFAQGNLSTSYAYIMANGFKKSGSNDNYALTGNGGHKAIGNANGNIPISNGTVNTNLNADMLDGYHAGNISGNIPISNGTVNINLYSEYAQKLTPLITKSYTNTTDFYATSTSNWDLASRFFMKVKPSGANQYWRVLYRVRIWIPASETYTTTSIVEYFGHGISMNAYKIWNTIKSGHAPYYHVAFWLKQAGFDAGYSHLIGESILYATNYTNSGWYRHMVVDLLAYDGCTIEMLDTAIKYSTITERTDTNYNGISSYNATSQGLQETGDVTDTGTIYLHYTRLKAGTNGIKQNSLIMQDGDGNWQSFTITNGTGTNKTMNTVGFRLGSKIYYAARGELSANTVMNGNSQTIVHTTLINLKYTLNINETLYNNSTNGGLYCNLIPYLPLYIVGHLGDSNNSEDPNLFYLSNIKNTTLSNSIPAGDVFWTQTEPTSEDGKIYIKIAESVYPDYGDQRCYRTDLIADGDAYWFKNGKFQRYGVLNANLYVGSDSTNSNNSGSNPYIKLSNGTNIINQYQIIGTGGTSVTSDSSGNITINSNNNQVTQNSDTANSDYRLLFKYSANDTNETNTVKYNTNLKYNPSTKLLSNAGIIQGTQLKSTIAQGTAPLIVTSATKVSNLNADLLDDYHETSFFRYRGNIAPEYADLTTYTANADNYQNPLNGIYAISRSGYSVGLIAFTGGGSSSGLDIYFHYQKGGDFKFRRRIDSNRLSGAWEIFITDQNYTSYTVKKDGTGASGTWGISITGNASTATTAGAFSSNATVTLTGDTTGTSAGSTKSWTVPTITKYITGLGRRSTAAAINLNSSVDTNLKMTWHISDSTSRTNDATNSPSFDAAIINLPWDWGGYNGQIAISNTIKDNTRMQIRSSSSVDNGEGNTPRYSPNYGAWREVVTAPKATQVGSSTIPIYISNTGQAIACSYTISSKINSGTANRLAYYKGANEISSQDSLIISTSVTYGSRALTPVLRVNSILYADSRIEAGDYFLVNKGSAGASFYLYTNNIEYGRLFTDTVGVASTTTTYTNPDDSSQTKTGYINGVLGKSILTLGNNKVFGSNGLSYSSPGSASTANNAAGYLRLYSTGSGYGELTGWGSWIHANSGLSIPSNKIGIMFRPDNGGYYTHFDYETSGNEALVMATQNTVTSFIFVNGESYANVATDRWTKLTGASGAGPAPGLQIKQNCVRIGGLWPSGTNAETKLRVDGTVTIYPNQNTKSSTTWTYPAGGYYATEYPNIRLIGDNDHGISTIEFISQKGDTSINKYTDCAFIQFNPYGVSAPTAIGTQPTLNTSGEANRLIIGVNNDSTDQLWLQTPAVDGLRHIVGTNNYRILTSQNTYVSSNKGYINGTEITQVNNATSATKLSNTSSSDPNTCADGQYVRWYSAISQSSGYAGNNYGFPVSNNANGILWLGTHSGPYGGQIGISSNGNIYYRYISNNSFPTTANGESWKKILDTANTYISSGKGYINGTEITQVNNADTVDNKHADDFVPYVNSVGGAVYNINSIYNWEGVEITLPWTYSPHVAVMFAFTIRIYNGYAYTDIVISGYNYGSNHWHNPTAEIIGGSKSYLVKFGWHNDPKKLYVWIGLGKDANNNIIKLGYGGLSIINVHVGHTNVNTYNDWSHIRKSEDDLVNVQSTQTPKLDYDWNKLINKPSSFTPASHNHDERYVKLDAGAAEQTIKNSIGSLSNGSIEIWRATAGGYPMIGFSNGTTKTKLGFLGFGSTANVPIFRNTSGSDYQLLHTGNTGLYVGGSGDLTTNASQATNGNVYLTLKAAGTYFKHNISGGTGISVTSDSSGNITITNTAPDTDTKVNQSETTTDSWRGIVLGYNTNASANTSITTNVTNVVYTTNNLTVQPSTGTISALHFTRPAGNGVSWVEGRDNALLRDKSTSGYHVVYSIKTADGSWELGTHNNASNKNKIVWSYILDTNYTAGTNTTTYQVWMPEKSGTIALTSDLPTVNNGTLNLQASGTTKTTFTANQSGTSTFNIATGSSNGTISVGGTDVAVKGLGSNAYNSNAYVLKAGDTMTGSLNMSHNSNENDFRIVGTSYTMAFKIGTGNTNRGIYQISPTSAWLLYFDASNTILNYGNIGIGISNPLEKLDINGNTRIRGNNEYFGTASGSQCHVQYDNTNRCLKIMFD